jgi:SET domain-containing protein
MASRSYQVRRSKTGLGLFATKQIKRGAYIATYRGPRITTAESDRREARGARYMFALNKRWVIDGSPRWNVARYINHACRPNAKPVGRKGGIVIVALRRIEPDEEITYDYGREYLKSFLPDGGCRCAACRRKQAQQRMRMSSKRRAKLASQHRSIIDNYANRDEKPRLSRSSVANKRFQRLSSCN